jgi:hypothetical protein
MKKIYLFNAIIFIVNILSCTTEPPPPSDENFNGEISLSVEDVSCTEAWLNLSIQNINKPVNVTVFRDDSAVINLNGITAAKDTILSDENLLPNKTYTYYAAMQADNQTPIASSKIHAATMDTTSHNFTWQSWTFGGEAGSSTLYDVAIIDENNIWAVGEIYLLDSLGMPDPTRYNLVVWNGTTWEVKRIPYLFEGQPFYHPVQSIFAFSADNIWFGGNGIVRWDGSKFIPMTLPISVWGLYQINKIWGSSSNDLYIVGNNGSIAHYQNDKWSKIESGTGLNINDIYGDYNERSSKYEILAPASNELQSYDRILININGNKVEQLSTEPIIYTISSVWFIPNRIYFLGGAGVYKKHSLKESNWKNRYNDVTSYYTYGIRGNNINDIVAAGGAGEVIHFNGMTWESFFNETRLAYGNYYSIAIKDNIITAVGIDAPRAAVIIGKR